MFYSGITPNDIYDWIEKKNNGDDTYYLNGKQDTEEAIDVFQSLYRCTFKNVYRLFLHLHQHLCMRVADSQSLYRAFIVLKNDEIITIRLSQHFSTKDATRRAFKRTGKPNAEYHLTINRVKPLNPNADIYYDRTLSYVEIKVREYDLSEFNDRKIRKSIIDEIIALLTYGTNKNENKHYMNMNKQVIRLTEGDLHKIVRESVKKILREEIYGMPGRKISSFRGEVPYDDDYVEKYGPNEPYASNRDDELDSEGFETTNQTISKDVAAFLHRVDNAITRKFGGYCDISYRMDSEDTDREKHYGGYIETWTDTEDTDVIEFSWRSDFEHGDIASKVLMFVMKMFAAYKPYGLQVTNTDVTHMTVTIEMKINGRRNDLGRNNKINISNKHGKNKKTFYDDKFRFSSDNHYWSDGKKM